MNGMRQFLKNRILAWSGHTPGIERLARIQLYAVLLSRLYDARVGAAYGITRRQKSLLLRKFQQVNWNIPSATSWPLYVVLATRIFEIDPCVRGAIIECGCYKGASTTALSLICSLAGRRLVVCDSFSGLPDDKGEKHFYPHLGMKTVYEPGLFAGHLDEVKSNISRWGNLPVCEFRVGFFTDSLRDLCQPLVFAFLDVDLLSSMKDCIRYIWPNLLDCACVYTDDSCDMELVKIWFDREFWDEIGFPAPGYIGSGAGLPCMSVDYSGIGYARKIAHPDAILKATRFW
jgi:hypothetical protein